MTGAPIPASALSHDGQPGLLRTDQNGTTQVDQFVDFTRKNGNPLPANFEATWAGALTVRAAGSYWIYLQLLGAAGSVSIDGKRVAGANGHARRCTRRHRAWGQGWPDAHDRRPG